MWARSKRSAASALCMRKQPLEAELPMEYGALVPWMRYSLQPRYMARMPSGLCGPGPTTLGSRGFSRRMRAVGRQLGLGYLALIHRLPDHWNFGLPTAIA